MNLLVLGPQGAGKGTQAARIATDHAIPHVSTGDMFRQAIGARTELGLKVEPILALGQLVPDEITIALIRDRLLQADALAGFVLDGFPRNPPQAAALDETLGEIGRRLDAALLFDLSDELATERLLERAAEQSRADDTPEVIAERLRIYHEETEPLLEHYRSLGILVRIHAERTIPEVYAEVKAALDELELEVRP